MEHTIEYTMDYILGTPESVYLDKKSARITPKEMVRHVVAFANANGGVLAIGVEDDNTLTGFSMQNAHSIDEYKAAIITYCCPTPSVSYQQITYGEHEGDFVLLIIIDASNNQIVKKTPNNEVFLRLNDTSQKLTHEQILNLEYDKGQRFFEDIEVSDASVDEDIDISLIETYKERMNSNKAMSCEQILRSRNLIRNNHLTNAALLLFGKNPSQYLPHARVKFIRYNGTKQLTGERINIIKEMTFDSSIPSILRNIAEFIRPQMREFQTIDKSGQFTSIPEYPEFAWFEGIVNALTHRDYSITGDYIRISMYDDRLEIFSPGKLPNIVTLENMQNTRYSRNPRIARVLSEFGWVKELNEGVKRIYDEMQKYFLHEPIYSEPNNRAVLLTLQNSITSRHIRAVDKLSERFSSSWDSFTSMERQTIQFLYAKGKGTTKEVAEYLVTSPVTARSVLKGLCDKEIIVWVGTSTTDPCQHYVLSSPTV